MITCVGNLVDNQMTTNQTSVAKEIIMSTSHLLSITAEPSAHSFKVNTL